MLGVCMLSCDPMDCSPPGSSLHRIFQARMLEGIGISSSRGSSQPRDPTISCASCIRRQILYYSITREAHLKWQKQPFKPGFCLCNLSSHHFDSSLYSLWDSPAFPQIFCTRLSQCLHFSRQKARWFFLPLQVSVGYFHRKPFSVL